MNKANPKIPPHGEGHNACDQRLAKFGGKTIGCCCVGHDCQAQQKVEKQYAEDMKTVSVRKIILLDEDIIV